MAYWFADRGGTVVAVRANSRRVVFVSGGDPADKTMAFVALICRFCSRVMGRRLADCRIAVMASRAGARNDAGVVPRRRAPCNTPVALVARTSRFLPAVVTCRFGSGLPAVMTCRALPWYSRAMVETRSQPGGGIKVAVFARCISHDMIIGFRGCYYALAYSMTAIATFRCTFENAANMTGLAGCCGMPAGKGEAGRHVIEIAPTLLRVGYSL